MTKKCGGITAANRGHWPKGRKRHDPGVEYPAVLRRLLARPKPGKISRYKLASACRVHDRTVRRWLSGDDLPTPATATRIRDWLARVTRQD